MKKIAFLSFSAVLALSISLAGAVSASSSVQPIPCPIDGPCHWPASSK